MKNVNGWPNIILNTGQVIGVKLSFVTCMLTSLESSQYFLLAYLKKGPCHYNTWEKLRCQTERTASEIKNTPKIFKHLRFLFHKELSWMFLKMDAIFNDNYSQPILLHSFLLIGFHPSFMKKISIICMFQSYA
jgi:hypothetical protein